MMSGLLTTDSRATGEPVDRHTFIIWESDPLRDGVFHVKSMAVFRQAPRIVAPTCLDSRKKDAQRKASESVSTSSNKQTPHLLSPDGAGPKYASPVDRLTPAGS